MILRLMARVIWGTIDSLLSTAKQGATARNERVEKAIAARAESNGRGNVHPSLPGLTRLRRSQLLYLCDLFGIVAEDKNITVSDLISWLRELPVARDTANIYKGARAEIENHRNIKIGATRIPSSTTPTSSANIIN